MLSNAQSHRRLYSHKRPIMSAAESPETLDPLYSTLIDAGQLTYERANASANQA
jgi:hypothetical protein